MFIADRRGTDDSGVGTADSDVPSTSSRLDAGSVLTSNTRRPASARAIAVALAAEVLPTPPFPVKNSMRVGFSMRPGMARPFVLSSTLTS